MNKGFLVWLNARGPDPTVTKPKEIIAWAEARISELQSLACVLDVADIGSLP